MVQNVDRNLRVTLPDRADVSSAQAMHELLLHAQIGAIDAVELDASNVAKLDVAVLQLLLAWLAVLDSQHIPWHWRGTSETFQQIVVLTGLAEILRIDRERPDENTDL